MLFELCGGVLVEELIDADIAAANADHDFILSYSYLDALGTKLVNPLRLSHKHDLKLVSVGIIIDIVCDPAIHNIILDWHIKCNLLLEVKDVDFESFNFLGEVPHLSQKFESLLIRLVDPVLKLFHVLDRLSHLFLVRDSNFLELTNLVRQRAFLILHRFQLIRAARYKLGLGIIDLNLLLVSLIRCLKLSLQCLILFL